MKRVILTILTAVISITVKAENDNILRIPLKPGTTQQRGSIYPLRLNAKKEGSINFPTSSGKLLFKLDGNKLVADTNGNGKIDKTDGPGIGRGQTFSIPIKSHGIKLKYEIGLMFFNNNMAYIAGKTVLQGDFKGKKVTISDSNLNGSFNDMRVDRISVTIPANQMPLTPQIALGGKIFDMTFPANKTELILKPYTGERGEIILKSGNPDWFGTLLLTKNDGSFNILIVSKNKTEIIPGTYFVRSATYSKGSPFHQKSQGFIYGQGKKPVTIGKKDNELKIGQPFKLKFTTTKSKDNANKLKVEEVKLIDSGDFEYDAVIYGKEESTLKCFIQAGNKKKILSTLEYG